MIKKTYHWKEITEDGLLKEPKEFGPYYSTESLNGWGGHKTEAEAYEKLEYMYKAYRHKVPSSLTLVTEYQVCDDDETDG